MIRNGDCFLTLQHKKLQNNIWKTEGKNSEILANAIRTKGTEYTSIENHMIKINYQ